MSERVLQIVMTLAILAIGTLVSVVLTQHAIIGRYDAELGRVSRSWGDCEERVLIMDKMLEVYRLLDVMEEDLDELDRVHQK